MDHKYDHLSIEKKWQKIWDDNKTFKSYDSSKKEKYYILDMFPYPSGKGLHVGHPLGYTATDVISRYKRMKGFNVLHPMGWDAFGLPAEQYALKTGTHPSITTKNNIDNFKKQIKNIGLSYDWDREINTTDKHYYKWTQWIFLKLYEKGLAYESEVPVNWCPELGTVLANEEVINGKSERGDHPVFRVPMKQWMLKITDYAEKLLEGLDDLDWPKGIKDLQKNWIGKSKGAHISFQLPSINEKIDVFTTRPDTIFGATYLVLAPEHPLVNFLLENDYKDKVRNYCDAASRKSELSRTELDQENKTGVFLGSYAINPVNDKKIPIWISDYVIMSYGSGAIMAVPAHDQRDYDFAKKFKLEIIETVKKPKKFKGEAYSDEGEIINSSFLDGLNTKEGKIAIIEWLEKNNKGKSTIQYKMRDWLFSRQRYWGEPFPIIHSNDKIFPVNYKDLPVELPEINDYKPSKSGDPPLSNAKEWVEVDYEGEKALRETNTMPQWAGSCWYYLRFLDPNNLEEPWSNKKEQYWMPVDLYIGGQEHAVLHLLYARFWHKVLYDLGLVSTNEPFKKLVNQGMILGEDGQKMSKSKGNVVNPDDMIRNYGADSLRLYYMFLGPLEKAKPWSESGIQGSHRFINKIWTTFVNPDGTITKKITNDKANEKLIRKLHQTIQKVTIDLEELRFNTAISQIMVLLNTIKDEEYYPIEIVENLILILSPFAPHICEEIWEKLGKKEHLSYHPWPNFESELTIDQFIKIGVQINGKRRGEVEIKRNLPEEDILSIVLDEDKLKKYFDGVQIKKTILIKDRVINIIL